VVILKVNLLRFSLGLPGAPISPPVEKVWAVMKEKTFA
jgi:hypothetical protein